jgi:1,4-dihydroxy-2-naphthoate octaprenyltransferase
MSAGKPIDEQTVKALSWQLLYGNFRPRLGKEGWQELCESVGAPNFRSMNPDENCPMGPFNEAVTLIDSKLGAGDGTQVEQVTIASVDRWASIYRNLVRQLQGNPQKMMEIFCEEVHPYFLNDPTASEIVVSSEDHFILRLDNGLLEGFKTGLIRGFCHIVGAEADVKVEGDEYLVTWKIRQETPTPSRWALFVNVTRLPFLTAAAVPVVLGTAVAWVDGSFNFAVFGLVLLGTLSFHVAANVANDYFDHTAGADEANLTPTPFAGGARLIQRGLLSPAQTRNLSLGFYAIGSAIGLILVWWRGWEIIYFGLAGILVGFLYSSPPLRLSDRGVGEVAVGLGFGPIIVVGAYWAQTLQWSWEAVYVSLPVAILIAAVVFINEFPDRPWDAKAGKRTLVVRLPIRLAIYGYAVLLGSAYLIILVGAVAKILPLTALLGLLTIPMGWKAYQTLRVHYAQPYRLIPANASTVFNHMYTGLLLSAAYLIAGILA